MCLVSFEGIGSFYNLIVSNLHCQYLKRFNESIEISKWLWELESRSRTTIISWWCFIHGRKVGISTKKGVWWDLKRWVLYGFLRSGKILNYNLHCLYNNNIKAINSNVIRRKGFIMTTPKHKYSENNSEMLKIIFSCH